MKSIVLIILSLTVSVLNAQTQFKKIESRNGVLYFDDGSEVALWGVNFQSSLSWEHAARMQNQNILMPLRSQDLKEVTDKSFDEIQWLGADVIRIHLDPSDFTDSQGNLEDTFWLDMLDYTLSEATNRGIYVYLTFMNHLSHDGTQFPPNRKSFITQPREEWIFKQDLIHAAFNYIRQLMNRKNPYNGLLYKNHPSLALIEPINEPAYIGFDQWKKSHPNQSIQEFKNDRYKKTLTYLNDIVDLFRDEGMEQPVIWSCNWPKMIRDHEDIFQAISASKVDAVSCCNYPGQDDLKPPFWKNPENLDRNNYMLYLQQCYESRDYLGYLLEDLFSNKAKVVYEYETMCNQSSYMYPAMAKMFRSLGAQVATQWTYGLTSYITHQGGSHVFNKISTPRKALSFMVAKEVFENQARGVPYKTQTETSDSISFAAWDYQEDLSASYNDGTLIYTRDMYEDFIPVGSTPQEIIGIGKSEFANFGGNSSYRILREESGYSIEVNPDVHFDKPHWKELHTGQAVLEIDKGANHTFKLRVQEHPRGYTVLKKVNYQWEAIPSRMKRGFLNFDAYPGEYFIQQK